MTTYKDSGVDIAAGDKFVEDIGALASGTLRQEVIAGIGGFAGLFALQKYQNPILVASTDGVGTKVVLANQLKMWRGIGIDCVAMCVNDIGCYGAEPLFFLDYLAQAKLDHRVLKEVVTGIANACKEVGCALLGGETAEMPGVYPPGEFDCAGFTVGVVEKEEVIDGRTIEPGDVLIGVASSGFHSNGFSLIRKIIETEKINLQMPCAETGLTLGETLMQPTRLYTPLIQKLKKKITIKGIAHITGGGLIENTPRVLPDGVQIQWNMGSWPIPYTMEFFRSKGGLDLDEFYRVFNAGIGLVCVLAAKDKEASLKILHDLGEKAWCIGTISSN